MRLTLLVWLLGLARAASPVRQQGLLAGDLDPDARNAQYFRHSGEPVPRGWRPMLDRLTVAQPTVPGDEWSVKAHEGKKSIGQIAETEAADDVTITYIHPTLSAEFVARDSSHKVNRTGSLPYSRARVNAGKDFVTDEKKCGKTLALDTKDGKCKKDPRKTGISRCGFTWDDAAAKMGPNCSSDPNNPKKCFAPPDTFSKGDSYWYEHPYMCYTDLPDIGLHYGNRKCKATGPEATDDWCNDNCNTVGSWCDAFLCDCQGPEEDKWKYKTPEVFDTSAPIAEHAPNISAADLPMKTQAMVDAVIAEAQALPSMLPSCTWRPQTKTTGCSKKAQYECIAGPSKGKCARENWFDSPEKCTASCVHTVLLSPAPYYALWYPGPVAKDWQSGEKHPRYQHTPHRLSMRARGIDLTKTDVMMSAICQSMDNQFVGISLYSPHYKDKAERLLRSCARVGVCCKARLLPADAFGPGSPEGSEGYRFEVIASKPSYILDELQTNRLPVVFLDTDLEFVSFPHLFVPGSWPNGGRDVAIFNFWGNETDYPHASTPTTGSGVVFFNQTIRATRVLTAWAEAMAWDGNTRAPDDQVLDTILKEGGWINRASYGWLPASYLRTMPSYYRGVMPVIEHDHGNMPGLLKHSTRKPRLPPVLKMDVSDRDSHGEPLRERAPIPRAPTEQEKEAAAASWGGGWSAQAEAAGKRLEAAQRKLPPGSCVAEGAAARDQRHSQTDPAGLTDAEAPDAAAWNAWCDENCVPEKWGALGGGSCNSGVETGAVGCVCQAGAKPVGGAAQQEKSSVGFQRFHATSKPDALMQKMIPAGKCGTTNPALQEDARLVWDHWCDTNCHVPEWRAEHCLTPEMSGPAMCACKVQL